MASSVAKLNMLTNGVFKNNDESIRFLELVNKSFTVAGASAEEQKSAMLQLTQAMASGRLQGDELRSISENSPMILQAIEKYAGISRAELRKMAADGKITSELIKNSIFAAAEDIESKFSANDDWTGLDDVHQLLTNEIATSVYYDPKRSAV